MSADLLRTTWPRTVHKTSIAFVVAARVPPQPAIWVRSGSMHVQLDAESMIEDFLLFIMMQRKHSLDRGSVTGNLSRLSSQDGRYQRSEVATPVLSPRLPTSRTCRLSDEGLAHEEQFWQSGRGGAPMSESALPWSDRSSRGDADSSCHDADMEDSPQHSPSLPQSMAEASSIPGIAPPKQWGPASPVPPEVQCSSQFLNYPDAHNAPNQFTV